MLSLKPYTALILSICRNADNIEIFKINGKLAIKSVTLNTKHSHRLVKKLDGCVYFERVTNTSLTVLPLIATDKKTVLCKPNSIEEYLLNPFSEVNIYLNQ